MTYYPYYKPDGTGLTEDDILRNFRAYLRDRQIDSVDLLIKDETEYDTRLAKWIDQQVKKGRLLIAKPEFPKLISWECSMWLDGQQVVYKVTSALVLTRQVVGCKAEPQVLGVGTDNDLEQLKATAMADFEKGF